MPSDCITCSSIIRLNISFGAISASSSLKLLVHSALGIEYWRSAGKACEALADLNLFPGVQLFNIVKTTLDTNDSI